MKILQLCKKFPYPLKDGESIAIANLSQALHQAGCELTLLTMNTAKHKFDIANLPKSYNHYKAIYEVEVDNRIKVVDAFLNLFSSESYHIKRFISPAFEAKLIELLSTEKYDIVQLETLYLAPYVDIIRQYSDAKIVMRSHNVEYEIWKRVTQNTQFFLKKWYLGLLTKRLKHFEIANINQYDYLLAITQRDLDFHRHLGCTVPATVVPIGLDSTRYSHILEKANNSALINHQNHNIVPEKLSCCFIGALDWMPNIEGVEWLLKEIWPKVIAKEPEAILYIAGRYTPDWLMDGHWPNVEICGEVENAAEFIANNDIMLVPLLSGGGMRVKILEGMALSKLVISTSIGIEGISAVHGEEALVADSSEDFAQEIVNAFRDINMIKRISKNAKDFVAKSYDNKAIAEQLIQFYEAQLSEKTPSSVH